MTRAGWSGCFSPRSAIQVLACGTPKRTFVQPRLTSASGGKRHVRFRPPGWQSGRSFTKLAVAATRPNVGRSRLRGIYLKAEARLFLLLSANR